MNGTAFDLLRRIDRERKGIPGEHWLALAAGLWFLNRKGGSLPARLASRAAGAALLYRAASGRDGLRRLLGSAAAHRRMQDRQVPGPATKEGAYSGGIGRDIRQVGGTAGADGFPERGAGSSYEPRSDPATRGFPDFR